MKIKILFAVGRLSVGGAEKLLVRQLPAISAKRFDPYLLTLFPEQRDSFSGAIKLAGDHWQKFNFRSLLDLPQWLKLSAYLRKEKFDVVVTSLFSANLIVRIAAILARIPVIIAYEHNLYPDKRRWQIWADRLLAKWTKRIIVDSEAVKAFTAKQENISEDKFINLYIPPLLDNKPVRAPAEMRKQLDLPADAKIILTVSRLVEEKGHRYLIEAAGKVLKNFPKVFFLIVGWGPLERSLKDQIQKAGLGEKVLLPGRLDIQEVLSLADVYVDSAIRTDLPVAVMEALKMEKPVVASAIGEIPVFVKNNETGFLVRPADPEGLAEKITLLLKEEKLAKQFGQAGGRLMADYSLESYMKTFEEIILNSF